MKIDIINASTVLTDDEIESVIPSMQKQVSWHFTPIWNVQGILSFSKDQPDPLACHMVILDNSDQAGALGYHELTKYGLPMGKVFAGEDIKYATSWTVTLSHEILEMLADPDINLCASNGDKFYSYEVCDAVENDSLGYKIDDILVSDFVFPDWFSPESKGQYDYMNHISQPFQLAKGGYISIFENGNWTQINSDQKAPIGSRRHRRTVNRNQWRKSK